jgi:hypothetical protein
VIVIIDGQQYSKSEPDKEQRDTIKRLVESINKKRTHSDVEKLKKIFVNKTKKVEESLKSGKTIDIEILADRVNQITIQMNEMIDIIKKSYQGSQEAPKTQASVSERTGEKPYR